MKNFSFLLLLLFCFSCQTKIHIDLNRPIKATVPLQSGSLNTEFDLQVTSIVNPNLGEPEFTHVIGSSNPGYDTVIMAKASPEESLRQLLSNALKNSGIKIRSGAKHRIAVNMNRIYIKWQEDRPQAINTAIHLNYKVYRNHQLIYQDDIIEDNTTSLNGDLSEAAAEHISQKFQSTITQLVQSDKFAAALEHRRQLTAYPEGQTKEDFMTIGGKRDKTFRAFHPNGNIKTKGDYDLDMKVGQWQAWHANQVQSIITPYFQGQKNGQEKAWHDNAVPAHEGLYRLDKKHQTWYYWHSNGNPAGLENWENGIKEGLFKYWTANKQLLEDSTYQQDKLHLRHRKWQANGHPIHEAEFYKGIKNGTYYKWYPNGQIEMTGTYVENQPYGQWFFWDAKGARDKAREAQANALTKQITSTLDKHLDDMTQEINQIQASGQHLQTAMNQGVTSLNKAQKDLHEARVARAEAERARREAMDNLLAGATALAGASLGHSAGMSSAQSLDLGASMFADMQSGGTSNLDGFKVRHGLSNTGGSQADRDFAKTMNDSNQALNDFYKAEQTREKKLLPPTRAGA